MHTSVDEDDEKYEKEFSALAAQERAQRVASLVGSHSAPASRRNSLEDDSERHIMRGALLVRIDDIPLVPMDRKKTYDGTGYDTDEGEDTKRSKETSSSEAHKLVRAHTRKDPSEELRMHSGASHGLVSGQVTPTDERTAEFYVPRPEKYRGGVLSSLLKLYNAPSGYSRAGSSGGSPSQPATPGSSGTTTPSRAKQAKWYDKSHHQDTLAGLVEASAMLGAVGGHAKPKIAGRAGMGRHTPTGKMIDSAMSKIHGRPRLEDEIRITVHIAETLSRQKYLLKLCRALMSYGAPTHRLEEYMKMTARVLEIDGQFLYIPGCMIVSFDDASTRTTEVKLVREAQGVNLGKLKDVHEIYKEVVHDIIGVEEATQRLDAVFNAKKKHNPWFLVLIYGFASATVAPFGKSIPYMLSDNTADPFP